MPQVFEQSLFLFKKNLFYKVLFHIITPAPIFLLCLASPYKSYYFPIAEKFEANSKTSACVVLLTLPYPYKEVGKCLFNVGVLSLLEFPTRCVPEGCPTIAPPPAPYKGV